MWPFRWLIGATYQSFLALTTTRVTATRLRTSAQPAFLYLAIATSMPVLHRHFV